MNDEELEEIETEENESENVEKVKLDFDMDSTERLKIEIESTDDPNAKVIGNYLLNEFENDDVLKNCYKERKIKLSDVAKNVVDNAKEYLKNKSGMIEDKVVFGWVLHYVQDEPIKITSANSYELTKEDKEKAKNDAIKKYQQEELQKIKDAEKRKLDKEIKKREESGQMSLFEGF